MTDNERSLLLQVANVVAGLLEGHARVAERSDVNGAACQRMAIRMDEYRGRILEEVKRRAEQA